MNILELGHRRRHSEAELIEADEFAKFVHDSLPESYPGFVTLQPYEREPGTISGFDVSPYFKPEGDPLRMTIDNFIAHISALVPGPYRNECIFNYLTTLGERAHQELSDNGKIGQLRRYVKAME